MTMPAAIMRARKTASLAEAVLSWAAAGIAGDALQRALERHGPADIDETAAGFTCRCYGTQSPPRTSPHAAILTWAVMALDQSKRA